MKEKMSAAVACLILVQVACGGGGGPAGPAPPTAASPLPTPTPVPLGPIDPALVGTWTGSLDGSYGPAVLTMELRADGTAYFQGTGQYCRVNGGWGVSGTEFSSRGRDCTGTEVTAVAPASSTTMAGTWSASSGRQGVFSVTKQ